MSYSLDSIIEKLLGETSGSGINVMAHCPLHEDRTPSLSIHREEGLWKCHQCGQGGDLQKLATLVGEELGPDIAWDMAIRSVKNVPPAHPNFAVLANALYNQGLQSPDGDAAIRRFLHGRGIRADARHHFWLGWDARYRRISFPYWDDDSRKLGNVRAIRYRSANGYKAYEQDSERAIYNVEEIRGRPKVLIAEGETDTLLAWGVVGADVKVCGIPGAGVSRAQWELWSLEFLFATEIYQAFDADKAGDAGAELCRAVLGEKVLRMRPDEGLDLSEHYAKHGRLPDVTR